MILFLHTFVCNLAIAKLLILIQRLFCLIYFLCYPELIYSLIGTVVTKHDYDLLHRKLTEKHWNMFLNCYQVSENKSSLRTNGPIVFFLINKQRISSDGQFLMVTLHNKFDVERLLLKFEYHRRQNACEFFLITYYRKDIRRRKTKLKHTGV